MPSLSLASIKEKAGDAKDYSAKRIARLQSPASKNLNWDMSKPPPPPAPPERKASQTRSRPPPPPHPMKSTSPTEEAPPRPAIPSRRSSTLRSPVGAPQPPSRPVIPSRPVVPERPSPPAQRRPPAISPPVSSPPRSYPEVQKEVEPDRIDWANLSYEDKQEFFSWLDEFFAPRMNKSLPPRSTAGTAHRVPALRPPVPPASAAGSGSPSVSMLASLVSRSSISGPPPVPVASRPQ